jgi:hypothetical protein
MSEQENIRLIQEFFNAFGRGDRKCSSELLCGGLRPSPSEAGSGLAGRQVIFEAKEGSPSLLKE